MENLDPNERPLSDNPAENLRMENELLKLKLQAELGAESHAMGNLPPEIENEFLKNILAFEYGAGGAKQIRVFDLLGEPEFEKADYLNDELLELALQHIVALLNEKHIVVDFSGRYDNRTMYKFITEELFEHEMSDHRVAGMITHFDYEEFHPNHKLDIENRAMEFISGWFEQKTDERSWELADDFILPNGTIWSKNKLAKKLKNIFDSYKAFADCQYIIGEINFELKEHTGMGFAEGAVKYIAVTEQGGNIFFEGPFKFYFSLQSDWWSIFYFVFPGFEFDED